ncbi:hypothetical protein [Clostridioides difficile]|uniref:hypothetical protein n=1 Tax=Clostridioides difficile TaxID=1496 RepID=UPI001EDB27EB|nr:hypothetical protein [Clostridioides difficile]
MINQIAEILKVALLQLIKSQKRFKIDKKWHKDAIESFSCCPYKFMYGYVINDAAKHYKDELQVKMYLGEIIKYYISIAWKKFYNTIKTIIGSKV